MTLRWRAGGQQEQSDQGGCQDLHGAAGEGSVPGAGAGEAAGFSLWPLGPCSPFIPIPGAGAGFQRKKMRASYRGNYVRIAWFR